MSKIIYILFGFLVFATAAHAGTADVGVPTAADMLQRIGDQIPNLMRMVTAMAFVMGMYFILLGLLKLKQYGEQRTMMSAEHSLKGPMIYLAIGALLIYLPSTVQVGMSSFWSTPCPYCYKDIQATGWNSLINVCFTIVQLFGTIAFIRGLVMLSHLGGHGQQGSFGKGMTHIIGGLFCINIYQFVKVVLATIGVTISGFNS